MIDSSKQYLLRKPKTQKVCLIEALVTEFDLLKFYPLEHVFLLKFSL